MEIMGFTADNASNNDTLVSELSILVPSFSGSEYRVRCFAHILNLVVKVRFVLARSIAILLNVLAGYFITL